MIKIKNLTLSFGNRRILSNLTLQLPKSGLFSLIGPNGVGKSTLLYCLVGSITNYSGTIYIGGNLKQSYSNLQLAKMMAFVPQEFFPYFELKVQDIVLMGRYPYLGKWKGYTKYDYQKCEAALGQLGISSLKNRWFNSLSGGEKQKVNIARALVQETKIILLDEALSQLDIDKQVEMTAFLKKVSMSRLIFLVSHNINLSSEYSDGLFLIDGGKIVCQGEAEEVLTKENLYPVYPSKRFDIKPNPYSKKPNIVYL